MTNSTGLVGCTIVAADAAETLAIGGVPVLLVQAVRLISSGATNAEINPVRDAKEIFLPHDFNNGTSVFEDLRTYWNGEDEHLYGLPLKEHFLQIHRSRLRMRIALPYTADLPFAVTLEIQRNCNYR